MTRIFYMVIKTLLVYLTVFGLGNFGFAPFRSAGGLIFAYDSDNFNSPVLAGIRYSGYDRSLIRIVGNTVFALGTGTTRVTATWNGYTCDFVVHASR